MTNHAGIGTDAAEHIAAEVRAELARQKRTAGELAAAIGITPHTVGRRLNGSVPFNVVELNATAAWLGIAPDVLMKRAERDVQAVAS